MSPATNDHGLMLLLSELATIVIPRIVATVGETPLTDDAWQGMVDRGWAMMWKNAESLAARRELDVTPIHANPAFRTAFATALARAMGRPESSRAALVEAAVDKDAEAGAVVGDKIASAVARCLTAEPSIRLADDTERRWFTSGSSAALWNYELQPALRQDDRRQTEHDAAGFHDAYARTLDTYLREIPPPDSRPSIQWARVIAPGIKDMLPRFADPLRARRSLWSPELIAECSGQVVTFSSRWTVHALEPEIGWVGQNVPTRQWGDLVAVLPHNDGTVIGVSPTVVARLERASATAALAWRPLWHGPVAFARRAVLRAAACDPSSGRIVVWTHPLRGHTATTAIWSGGPWLTYEDPRHHPDHGDLRPKVAIQMVHDGGLGLTLRFGVSEVAGLVEGQWEGRALDPVARAIHPYHRAIAHDETTGETLMVDLESRMVVRFDLSCSVVVGRTTPQEIHTPGGLSVGACGYLPRRRTLYVVPPGQELLGFALDHLGAAFDAASKLGPRTSWG